MHDAASDLTEVVASSERSISTGMHMGMKVINRKGVEEEVRFDKIQDRIDSLTYGLHGLVDTAIVTQKVIEGMADGITTRQLDQLAAETAASMMTTHPDYGRLAARIIGQLPSASILSTIVADTLAERP